MNEDRILPDPMGLVCSALGCARSSLTEMSAINRHPSWDSFGHLQVMLALEREYKIEIDEEAIETYTSIGAIAGLYKRLKEIHV